MGEQPQDQYQEPPPPYYPMMPSMGPDKGRILEAIQEPEKLETQLDTKHKYWSNLTPDQHRVISIGSSKLRRLRAMNIYKEIDERFLDACDKRWKDYLDVSLSQEGKGFDGITEQRSTQTQKISQTLRDESTKKGGLKL